MKLRREYVEKPWGRTELPPIFKPPEGKRIGEVWFTCEKDLPLLAKYIFTGEALSIQVHPSDEQARARGLPSGKAECWYILDAAPDAVIGLGPKRELTADHLRSAALDGSIEQLINWQSVRAGDFIFVPPGTIHAIGAGLSLLEFQQNVDVTYRLYDYGRPRELHLDAAVDVSTKKAFDAALIREVPEGASLSLVDGPVFRLTCGTQDSLAEHDRWVMPISGRVQCANDVGQAGEVIFAERGAHVSYDGAWALTGATV